MYYLRTNKIELPVCISLRQTESLKTYNYHRDSNYEYHGVETEDIASFISSQPAELEISQLTYLEIEHILRDCKMMKDLDSIIETRIADRYSTGKELKMRDLAADHPDRIEYEEYKESVKAPIRQKKKDIGLIE
jgi:hypothetical protein